MPKNSKRNRHTGHVNAFKQRCIDKGHNFAFGKKVYSLFAHAPHITKDGVRRSRTLVRIS